MCVSPGGLVWPEQAVASRQAKTLVCVKDRKVNLQYPTRRKATAGSWYHGAIEGGSDGVRCGPALQRLRAPVYGRYTHGVDCRGRSFRTEGPLTICPSMALARRYRALGHPGNGL